MAAFLPVAVSFFGDLFVLYNPSFEHMDSRKSRWSPATPSPAKFLLVIVGICQASIGIPPRLVLDLFPASQGPIPHHLRPDQAQTHSAPHLLKEKKKKKTTKKKEDKTATEPKQEEKRVEALYLRQLWSFFTAMSDSPSNSRRWRRLRGREGRDTRRRKEFRHWDTRLKVNGVCHPPQCFPLLSKHRFDACYPLLQ